MLVNNKPLSNLVKLGMKTSGVSTYIFPIYTWYSHSIVFERLHASWNSDLKTSILRELGRSVNK